MSLTNLCHSHESGNLQILNLMTLGESHEPASIITAMTAQDSAYYFNI